MLRTLKMSSILFVGSWLFFADVQPLAAQEPADDAADEPIRIADLGLGEQVPSAIDLVGPEHGPAGHNRAALVHRMQCWIDGIERCSFADRNDPRVRAIRRELAFGPVDRDAAVVVHFPDFSRIEVRLVRASEPGSDALTASAFAPVVLPETARAPGLPAVPTEPVHFVGFAYEGAPEIRAALQRLEQRLDRRGSP